jgi:hypothetical protein
MNDSRHSYNVDTYPSNRKYPLDNEISGNHVLDIIQ